MEEVKPCDMCVEKYKQYGWAMKPAVYHGLCEDHHRLTTAEAHPYASPSSAPSAIKFITSLSQRLYKRGLLTFPIFELPVVGPEMMLPKPHPPGLERDPISKKYKYTPPTGKFKIREELILAAYHPNVLERPIIFLVNSVTTGRSGKEYPHTGIYVLNAGVVHSCGYGFASNQLDLATVAQATGERLSVLGVINSPDIQISSDFNERSVILWVGILTPFHLKRLQDELNLVTHVTFYTNDIVSDDEVVEVVDTINSARTVKFVTPTREYQGDAADTPDLRAWNCHKWALYILFGDISSLFDPADPDQIHANLQHFDVEHDTLLHWYNAIYSVGAKDVSTEDVMKQTIATFNFSYWFKIPSFLQECSQYAVFFDGYCITVTLEKFKHVINNLENLDDFNSYCHEMSQPQRQSSGGSKKNPKRGTKKTRKRGTKKTRKRGTKNHRKRGTKNHRKRGTKNHRKRGTKNHCKYIK
jgi:hypothetical protein